MIDSKEIFKLKWSKYLEREAFSEYALFQVDLHSTIITDE